VDFSRLKYDIDHRVCRIVMSRPDEGNALDDQLIAELTKAITRAQRDADVKVILLLGEGEAFSHGLDPRHLRHLSSLDFNQNLEDSSNLMRLLTQIYALRKPVIAVVHGPAYSTGCGLVAVCDLVLAARETAKFGFPEVRMGLVPAIALPFLVRRLGEGRARALVLRGTPVSAEEAARAGLVDEVVPAMEIERRANEIATQWVNSNSASSMGLIKELLARVHGMGTNEAMEYAANLNALARMTDDSKKGIEASTKDDPAAW